MAHFLMNSSLAIDFSHIEAALQARRDAARANLALLSSLQYTEPMPPPTTATFLASRLAVPFRTEETPQIASAPRFEPPQGVEEETSKQEDEDIEEESLQESLGEEIEEVAASNNDNTLARGALVHKRNPNELCTATPVTCLEDFMRMPIPTTLNNLKLPSNKRKSSSQRAVQLSVRNQPVVSFSSDYQVAKHDVVVDIEASNKQFRSLIRQSIPNYVTASNHTKRQSLIGAIISTVSSNGGHFLRYTAPIRGWTEVEKSHAERFIAHSLQEAADNRSSVEAAKAALAVSKNLSEEPAMNVPIMRTTTANVQPEKTFSPFAKRVSYTLADYLPRKRTSISETMPSLFEQRSSSNETKSESSLEAAMLQPRLPELLRKRPRCEEDNNNKGVEAGANSNEDVEVDDKLASDRSALQIKFKRPKGGSNCSKKMPRKVSMQATQNPLEFLSEIAALDSSESGDDSSDNLIIV